MSLIKKNDLFEHKLLGTEKDVKLLQTTGGFALGDRENFTALIQPDNPPNFIAVLQFKPNQIRGNHGHHEKLEHMFVIYGKIKVHVAGEDDPDSVETVIVKQGELITFFPKCIHAIEAIDDIAYTIELSPQVFDGDDTFFADIA